MRDLGSGLVLAALALAYFVGARGLPAGQDGPGPRFFPFLLAAALLFLAGGIIGRGWRKHPASTEPLRRPAALIVLTALYAFALPIVGLVISTFAYAATVVLLLGQSGWRVLAIPAVTTALIYLAFVVGLGVVLP